MFALQDHTAGIPRTAVVSCVSCVLWGGKKNINVWPVRLNRLPEIDTRQKKYYYLQASTSSRGLSTHHEAIATKHSRAFKHCRVNQKHPSKPLHSTHVLPTTSTSTGAPSEW